jgi:anti-sigma B factor antagonist
MSDDSAVLFEQQGLVTLARVLKDDALEAANVAKFGQEALEYVMANPACHLLLDLEAVEYLSSAALSEILVLHRKCHESGGDIRLCGMSNDVLKVFKITQLDRIVEVYDSPAPLAAKLYNRTLAGAGGSPAKPTGKEGTLGG